MLYRYEVATPEGEAKIGTIEAANRDIAISALQRRNLIIISIVETREGNIFSSKLSTFLNRIKARDIVILSRQLSTLFEAKVPVLTSLKLLAAETENPALREKMAKLVEDIQGGASISDAMARQPEIFSKFFVSMVRSGEESGKLDEVFSYLASYLERNYELVSKARGALVYPAFVVVAFIGVMILMMTYVIPKLSGILRETEQALPFYTRAIMGTSDFLINYGIFLLIMLIAGVIALWFYFRTSAGKAVFSRLQLNIPYIGVLYRKLYLSRMMDNFETLLSAGISVVRTLELTADVIDNEVYRQIIVETTGTVKGGASISESFSRYEDVPSLVVQMIKVGEETGKLSFVFKTLATFYKKEIDNAIAILMSLIEPVLIIVLGLGVGFLVAGILGPIYNLSAGI
jgi:type IV pilus assembly protein PilC